MGQTQQSQYNSTAAVAHQDWVPLSEESPQNRRLVTGASSEVVTNTEISVLFLLRPYEELTHSFPTTKIRELISRS